MNDNKNYSEEWKKYLITELKACAKVLNDNAEEIIGKYVFTGDLDIMITIDTNGSQQKYPRINISKDYFPDYRSMADAYNEFKDKRKEDSINGIVINHCKTSSDEYGDTIKSNMEATPK